MILLRNLKKELKIFNKNLNPGPSLILQTFINCCESANSLGFDVEEKVKIHCLCSTFYGKILKSKAFFNLKVDEYLKSHNAGKSISCYYQQLSASLNPSLDMPVLTCPDKFCTKEKSKKQWTILKEPDSLAIQIIWTSKQSEASDIMAVLIGINSEIKLSEVYKKKFQKILKFKGMILETPEEEFVYFTKFNQTLTIINDSKISKIVGEDWRGAVYNFCIHFYRPVLIFYAFSDLPPDDMQLEEIEYIQVLIHQEIGLFDPWTCLCCDFSNSPEVDICINCSQEKTNKVNNWTCECSTSNTPQSIFCSECSKYRFPRNNTKCSNCKKPKQAKNCIICYGFKCWMPFCGKLLNFGQQMIHKTCEKECYGYCETCKKKLDSRSAICMSCFKRKDIPGQVLESFICGLCSESINSTLKGFCFNCQEAFTTRNCPSCSVKSSKICKTCSYFTRS